jgi:hypothetical protein
MTKRQARIVFVSSIVVAAAFAVAAFFEFATGNIVSAVISLVIALAGATVAAVVHRSSHVNEN